MHPVLLPTDAVIEDPDIQSRVKRDEAFAEEYAQDVKAGKNFPPVKVFSDGEKYLLADGFHRLRAHILAGQKFIRAEVCSGTKRDAILYSVSSNAAHGIRRKSGDKTRAVTMLLIDKEWGNWSNNRIAKACNVSHTLVGQIRTAMTSNGFKFDGRRETVNGNIMDTSKIGQALELKKKVKSVFEQIEDRSPAIDEIVDYSPFDPDEVDELDQHISKIREELKAMRQAMRSKRTELSTLEAQRQRLTSVALQ